MILPNVLVAVLSGAFLTFAIVIGEFTMAALLDRPAFGPYMQLIGANRAYEPAALAVIAFAITWACMGLIQLVTRLQKHTAGRGLMAYPRHRAPREVLRREPRGQGLLLSPIEKGEFVSLLGPSGCGKTTVLRMVAGFETPDRRRASASRAGTSSACAPNQRNIGMVFQAYALFPNLTVARERGLRAQGRGGRTGRGARRAWRRCWT